MGTGSFRREVELLLYQTDIRLPGKDLRDGIDSRSTSYRRSSYQRSRSALEYSPPMMERASRTINEDRAIHGMHITSKLICVHMMPIEGHPGKFIRTTRTMGIIARKG